MDAEVADALGAVELDFAAAARWLDAVIAAHGESGGDWDRFRQHLDSYGDVSADQVERFTNYVDQYGRMELIDKMVALGGNELLSAYEAQRTTAAPAAGVTEDPWSTLVAAHGGDWAGFTGTEQSWAEHRDSFYINANAMDPQLYALAYQQLNPLEDLPMEQRLSALQSYGFTVTAQPAAVQDGTGMAVEDVARILEEAALAG